MSAMATKITLALRLVRNAGAVLILWLASASVPARAGPEIGEVAPSLVLTGLDGQTFDLSRLRGKVVLVNYWATWCAPCRKEMPTLNAFYRRYRGDGLELIGISVDFRRDLDKVRKAAAALSYPIAVSGEVTDNGFGMPDGVPVTYVIDTEGVVRDMMIAAPDKLLHDIVLPLLPHRADGERR